jgi:phosphoglycerate dehydrogenase-like enzyme
MASRYPPRIAVAPTPAPSWIEQAVQVGGGQLVDPGHAQGLIWSDPQGADELEALLADAPDISWVQVPFAGVETFIHLVDDNRQWSCGKGVYADPVAELALGLALAGMRNIGAYARADEWTEPVGVNLFGARVTILGGGGITAALLPLLLPFRTHTTVVRNRVKDMDGADAVLGSDRLIDALTGADLVILALSLTPETEGIISRSELELMERHAWIVNVARGRHIVTDDLVWALQNHVIGGAALDVTEPEPLPADHPLWSVPNCIISPHVGNTPEMGEPLLAERIATNVRRFGDGQPPIGPIDVDLGY